MLKAARQLKRMPEVNCNLQVAFDNISRTGEKINNYLAMKHEDDESTRDTLMQGLDCNGEISLSKRNSFADAFV